jgi:hypothetical protein
MVMYNIPTTNIANRSGQTGNNSPNYGSDHNESNATRWQDFRETIELICQNFEKIDAVWPHGNLAAEIRAAADLAICLKSKVDNR